MIADNRLSELSTWDDQVLGETLQELSLLNLDFSIEATGFDMGEIDFRIEALSAAKPKADRSDLVPEPAAGPPVTVLGDLWELDGHRVLCGSALEAASYAALMAGEQAAMVFTDPPYNVPIGGHVSGLGAVRHREFAMACGEMSVAEFTAFLRQAMGLLAEHSRDGSLHMVCMDWRHMGEVIEAAGLVYSELKNLCVWAKDNAGMGSLYRSQHELVFVYKRGTAKHVNNVELGRHGRNRTNVWSYPGANSFGRKGEGGQPAGAAPDGQTGQAGVGRDPGLHGAGRHRAGRVPGQRVDADRGWAGRAAVLRHRSRSALRGHDRAPLAGRDRGRGPARDQRGDVRRQGGGRGEHQCQLRPRSRHGCI